jgi:hypothetical protein
LDINQITNPINKRKLQPTSSKIPFYSIYL